MLSVCIPTINRPEFCTQALISILETKLNTKIEICIFNNASTSDYSELENLIKINQDWNIKYNLSKDRLLADESMHSCIKMCSSEYIFLLGDDDYFVDEHLNKLINFIDNKNPDLAIFNGFVIDKDSKVLHKHFRLKPQEFHNVNDAFNKLRTKGSFGSILVKRSLLIDSYIEKLYGSDHAYGAYWFPILESNEKFKIFIPNFECVKLRKAKKTYNLSDIYFNKIPYEIDVYENFLTNKNGRMLNMQFKKQYYKDLKSIIRICEMVYKGIDLKNIKNSHISYNHPTEKIKIYLARLLIFLKLYQLLIFTKKFIYR